MTPFNAWQQIQRYVGARPDGIPGIHTAQAVAAKLGLTLSDDEPPLVPATPLHGIWPHDDEINLTKFYGQPCDESQHTLIVPAYPLYMEGQPLPHITVHARIAIPVNLALDKVLQHYGHEAIARMKLNVFDGCYNCRPITGGSRHSVHAFAAALDFDAADNEMHQNHNSALFAGPEYTAWFQIWESVGATSLGRARDFDWMHLQFASL